MNKVIGLIMVGSIITAGASFAAEKEGQKKKLQIVFLMGQSNMVGMADVKTAWYLNRPQYVPPEELAKKKTRYFNWSNLFWKGLRTFKGPQKYKDALHDLYLERRASRAKWRQRVRGVHGPWKEEWGEKPKGRGRAVMYAYLDRKAEKEGIYKRIEEILNSPANEFSVDVAYNEIVHRDEEVADELKLVREYYLGDATPESFDEFEAAVEEAGISSKAGKDAEVVRAKYAELAKEYLNLPLAERTRIYAYGHVTGSGGEGNERFTQGPLSVGFGGGLTTIGPEYGVGMALERLVDAPILLVKCSWGNTALNGAWRPPSLDGRETRTEKANREAWNRQEEERAEKAGREPRLREAPEKTGELSYCWGMTLPQIEEVLADPGKYHPDYAPDAGYEVAGMVWFQGYSDRGNKAYGEQLVELVKFMRDKTNTPNLPVVCGTLGMAAFKHMAFDGEVNGGMVWASRQPGMVGTVDVVNTAPYFPVELEVANTVLRNTEKDSKEHADAQTVLKRAVSNKGFHYFGSAKCMLLMGDAMGRSLANLMAGGEPKINAVAGESH